MTSTKKTPLRKIPQKILFSTLLLTSIVYGCQQNDKDDKGYFSHKQESKPPAIAIRELQLDTIKVDLPVTSFVGKFQMHDQTVFFIDEVFCIVDVLNLDGKFKSQHLGKGHGPKEIPRIQNFLATGDKYIATHDWKFYVYDTTWTVQNTFVTDWNAEGSRDLLEHPDPSIVGMYEPQYTENRLRYDPQTGELFIKVITEHQTYNAFTTPEFYAHSRILGSIDLAEGKIKSVFGRFSPAYSKYNLIPFHSYAHYDFADAKFFISFEPDSLIYTYDRNLNALSSFGNAGINVSHKYHETNELDVFEDVQLQKTARNMEGYYGAIDVVKSANIIFRKYQQDGGGQRLQIYKEQVLIGDVSIPENFRIMGYTAPYFYASGIIDEVHEKLAFFKFKLD